MTTLIQFLAVAALSLACLGFGGTILRIFQAHNAFESCAERLAIGFALGLGFTGWALFFPGVLGLFVPEVFWALVVIGVVLLAVGHRHFGRPKGPGTMTPTEIALSALLFLVLSMDLIEGIAPPADADTLSYHFALPRDFVFDSQVSFVARAVSGAIPLLLHMTYGAALGMGGELAVTLWVMVTGWAAASVLFAVARQALSRSWSLALAIVFLTTPAVLYGGGSGQAEIRCAIFVMASAWLLVIADRESSYRILALAGICAGFFIGSKFFGLIFAGAAGLMLIAGRDGIRRGLLFGGIAAAIGCQWYFWNWLHTGDPVFPLLTGLLQRPDTWFWTQDFNAYFTQLIDATERPLDRSLLNWVLYPVFSIFNIVERLEGGRTGFGLLVVIVFPLFLAGVFFKELRRKEYTAPLLIALVFYTVWFFGGGTQRTRHLLPIYPLLLLGMMPIAIAVAGRFRLDRYLAAGIATVLCIQIAGQIVFSLNYAKHAFTDESRSKFLERNVAGANAASWVNANSPAGSKLGFMYRELAYLIERPSFMLHPHIQAVVDTRPSNGDSRRFVEQLRMQKITHLLLSGRWWLPEGADSEKTNFNPMIRQLVGAGCLKRTKTFDTVAIPSRTLKQFGGSVHRTKDAVFEIAYRNCPGFK